MDRFQYLEILENAMILSVWPIRGLDYIFMYANASCHKVYLITNWMDENDVDCTTSPVQSPDLNPIENLWDYLERKLEKLLTNLFQLNDLWENIPSGCYKAWSHQSHEESKLSIKARGGHTKY